MAIAMDKMERKRDRKIKTKEEEIALILGPMKVTNRKMLIRIIQMLKRRKLTRRISLIMKKISLL